MVPNINNIDEFLDLPTETIREIVYPHQLNISLLLNGTRRWYISRYFDAPPKDNSYLSHYLETVLVRLADLLQLLADHGLYRIFLPVYSEDQQRRETQAYEYLIKGIVSLKKYPALVNRYQESNFAVNFYGDASFIHQPLRNELLQPTTFAAAKVEHELYYDVNTTNPYNYLLKLSHEFSMSCGRAPSWEDMVEMYYGTRNLSRLNSLIAFNRLYSRVGIPPLLEGNDRIYMTVVTPLVLTARGLRRILYDYLYNSQDAGRNYVDVHPNEIQRLKRFYEANQETILGLTKKYEDFVYPLPGPTWPSEME